MTAELGFRASTPPLAAAPAPVLSEASVSDAPAVSPDELVHAVRQVPTDARAVFARHGSLERLDAVMRHPSAAGWSPLQHLAHIVDTLHRTAMWAVAALDEGRTPDAPFELAARSGADQAPPRAVLGALDQASSDLADALIRVPTDAWAAPLGDGGHAATIVGVLDRTIGDVHLHLAAIDASLGTRPGVPRSARA